MPVQLPLEVLEQIVEAILPTSFPIAFTASDVVTRTFVSLSLTCRALGPISYRLLYHHCLDVRSPATLKLLVRSLTAERVQDALLRPPVYPLGLWLAPYTGDTIDVPEVADQIRGLFAVLARHLERLVIDMPLRSLYPEEDHCFRRPVLRSAFLQLTRLKDFTSIRDELYLSTTEDSMEEQEVWTFWPRLERLALYNIDASGPQFLRALPQAKKLEQLVLTRADGIEWERGQDEEFHVPHSLRELKVLEVGFASPPRTSSLRSRLHGHIRVPTLWDINIPVPDDWDFEDPITLAQNFVALHARAGTLWAMRRAPKYVENMHRSRP